MMATKEQLAAINRERVLRGYVPIHPDDFRVSSKRAEEILAATLKYRPARP